MAEQNDRTTLGTAEWGRGFVEELARETLKEKACQTPLADIPLAGLLCPGGLFRSALYRSGWQPDAGR